ncbi:MAG TPA: OmpA family protein [Alphaproteobacteria bacterium]|nr:OmpA family protein [Alphaproteobacteria bacterium]
MKAHGFKLHRLLAVMALAVLSTGAGHTTDVVAEAGAGKAEPIQCACCWNRKGGYPPVHCAYFCDKGGRFDRVFFEPRSSRLTPATMEILRKQAICLKRNKFSATLFASADPHETPDDRRADLLSARRAASVKNFFVSRGIPPSAIQTRAQGRFSPATEGRTPEDRKFNRVVTIFHGSSWK